MGQKNSTTGGPINTSSDIYDEPKTFMTKAISSNYRVSVVKTDHIRLGLQGLVVGVDRHGEEIRLLNHWLMRGADMAMTEELLEKSSLYENMVEGAIMEKEFKVSEEAGAHKLKIYLVKYPRYSGMPEQIQKLEELFTGILDKARSDGIEQLGIPVTQTATMMTFPRSVFCQSLVKQTFEAIKSWKSRTRSYHKSNIGMKMNVLFLSCEMSGCRIMCKELIEYCEMAGLGEYDELDPEDALEMSSVEFMDDEKDKVDIKKIKGLCNEEDDDFGDQPNLLNPMGMGQTRQLSVTRKSLLKSFRFPNNGGNSDV